MAGIAGTNGRRWGNAVRIALWSMAALALALPLAAMQLTDSVNWTSGDFIFVALLIGAVGLAAELTVRASPSLFYRGGVALALAAGCVIVVATGAVGMVGNEGDPYNLLFFGVIGLALLGAVAARFRAAGLSFAMAAAGLAQAAIAVVGISIDPRGGAISAAFAALWLLSAAAFRKAAAERR